MPARSLHGFLNPLEVKRKKVWLLAPLFGCLLFVVLYIFAASLYPGGSQANAQAKGFSWQHNYWCNLLNEKAINGAVNPARPVAIAAMVIMALTLLNFFVVASVTLPITSRYKKWLLVCGLLAVAVLPFLPTTYHDSIINISGVCGLVALSIIYAGIYKNQWYALFFFGLFQVLLMALNNYLYYKTGMLYYLPVVQKISFLSFLLWICLVDIRLYQNAAKNGS